MNYLALSQKITFSLLGLWILSNVVWAADCPIEDKTSWEKCKGKSVKVSGTRLLMEDVPEYYMLADPSLSGGEGFQDQMEVAETQIILHTTASVECTDAMEAEGTVKQLDLEGNKVWALDVTKLTCK
jgi:predicted RNA-binding protein